MLRSIGTGSRSSRRDRQHPASSRSRGSDGDAPGRTVAEVCTASWGIGMGTRVRGERPSRAILLAGSVQPPQKPGPERFVIYGRFSKPPLFALFPHRKPVILQRDNETSLSSRQGLGARSSCERLQYAPISRSYWLARPRLDGRAPARHAGGRKFHPVGVIGSQVASRNVGVCIRVGPGDSSS